MDLRPLGSTDILVSPLGLGTVKLGRNAGVKYPTSFELPTDEEAARLIDTARDLGINLLDTAPAYGTSEERLGRLIARDSDRWVIATKVGEEFEEGESRFDFSPLHTVASVERSLTRLGRDHLDIVLVHASDDDVRIVREEGVLDTLAQLKSQGKVRAIGFSPKTLEGALAALPHCDVLMLTLNPVEHDHAPAAEAASRAGVGVLVKKALASGHVERLGENPAETAFRFALAQPAVASVIVGTLNPEHLRDNAAAVIAALRG